METSFPQKAGASSPLLELSFSSYLKTNMLENAVEREGPFASGACWCILTATERVSSWWFPSV